MADIFLSYTHVDRPRARPIVELFESEGWTVWWDRGIEPGKPWLPELEAELAKCRAVVLLCSKTSVKSEWLRREAQAGIEKGALVPILIDSDQIPDEFASVQATDLSRWNGDTHITEVEALLRRLANLVPPSRIDTVRPGYDPEFLGKRHPITLPSVTGAAVVIRYLHFTVIMNPARRLAHYVAYNVDGSQFVKLPRGPMTTWSTDPLLPVSLQMDLKLLRKSGYDRGQLMARSTACWGEPRAASISGQQAFYWPNVAPQEPRLNRYWWLALEKWERDVASKKERVIGFSGPVFSDKDRLLGGPVEFEHGLVAYDTFRVPRSYWKVVVAVMRGKLAMAAYLMDQMAMGAQGVGRRIKLMNYRIALADLEKTAEIRFPKSLHQADTL